MTPSTDKRPPSNLLHLTIFALAFSQTFLSFTLLADPSDPPVTPSTDAVDPGTKQLTSANGLFQRGLFKLAAQSYQEFLQNFPQHPQRSAARFGLGISRYRLSDFQGAVDPLREVLADDRFEQKDELLAVLGYCELSTHQYNDALHHLDALIHDYPQSKQLAPATLYRAQALYFAGRPREAADACQTYIRDHPQDPDRVSAWYFLALSQKSLGDTSHAMESLAEIDQHFPQSPYRFDAVLLTGQILESQAKPDAAIERYRQLLSFAPADRASEAHYALGLALSKTSKLEEAEKELTVVSQKTPPDPYASPARLQLGMTQLAAGHTSQARQTLEQVAQQDPPRAADARFGIAQCDFTEKKFDASLAILDALQKAQPSPASLPRIQLYRGLCLIELSKLDDALTCFDDLLAKTPDVPEAPQALYRSAYCLHQLKRYDDSHSRCQRLQKLPHSDLTLPAAELDAENLFLLSRFADAQPAFDALARQNSDAQRQLLFKLRSAQCDYFLARYDAAIARLVPLANDPRVAQSPQLRQAMFLLGDARLQTGKNAEAAAALQQYLSVAQGDTTEAQYKLSVARLRSGDTTSAKQSLEKLTTTDAPSAQASPWIQRGLLELAQLRYHDASPSAAEPVEKLLSANPPDDLAAPAHYLMGWIRFDAKAFPEAAEQWKLVREKYRDQPVAIDAAFQEGIALAQAGRASDAVAALQSFAAAHPQSPNAPKAQQLAASVLSSEGKHQEAAQILTKLADAPSPPDTVLYDLAWSQRRSSQPAAAEATYRRLLSQSAHGNLTPAVRTELSELLYADKRYADAVEQLKQVVDAKDASAKVLSTASYRLAWCYQKLSQFDAAATAFAAFASRWPDDELASSAQLQAALAQADAGHQDQSQQALTDMLKRFPDSKDAPVARLKLAEIQAAQGDFDESLKTARDFLARYPADPLAYRAQFGIGWAMENQKHYADARAQYQKVIAATNGETAARAQFQIGETFLAEQNYEQAIAAFLAVEDVYAYPKWSARALFEAGRSFEQLKQIDQAKQQYSQLVSKYKDAPEAELAQDRLKSFPGS